MKLYYLHGFRSHHSTATKLDALKHYYIKNSGKFDITLENIEYNPHKPIETQFLLDSIFKEPDDECIVVGCSLGGFWASYIASQYGIPAILINPSISPSSSLYVGKTTVFQTGEEMEVTQTDLVNLNMTEYAIDIKRHTAAVVCILTKDDEVIDYRFAAEYYKDKKLIILDKGGHQLDINSWRKLVKTSIGKELFWMAG